MSPSGSVLGEVMDCQYCGVYHVVSVPWLVDSETVVIDIKDPIMSTLLISIA